MRSIMRITAFRWLIVGIFLISSPPLRTDRAGHFFSSSGAPPIFRRSIHRETSATGTNRSNDLALRRSDWNSARR